EPVGCDARIDRQSDQRERLLGELPAIGEALAAVLSEEGARRDVLDQCEIAQRPRNLEGAADALVTDAVRRQPGDVGTLEVDRTAVRRIESRDAVERRALAR